MPRRRALLAAPLALAACYPRADQPAPDQAALVLVRFQEAPGGLSMPHLADGRPAPFAGPGGLQTTLVLSRFDPATNQAGRLPNQEVALAVASAFGPVDQTVAMPVRPGTYAITRFTQAGRWAECFNTATVAFDIAPGQALYLGRLDAKLHTAALAAAATAAHKQFLNGTDDFIDYAPPPLNLRAATPKDLQAAQDAATAADPAITTPVQPATLRPATFSLINRGILGYGRICGALIDSANSLL